MKKDIPWTYEGAFTLALLTEELARFIESDAVVRNGRNALILSGKIRYSHKGYEFRTFEGLPFYFAPSLIVSIRTIYTELVWAPRLRVPNRVCRRCRGSGQLLRPEKRRLLRFIRCSDCGGRGLSGKPHCAAVLTPDEGRAKVVAGLGYLETSGGYACRISRPPQSHTAL